MATIEVIHETAISWETGGDFDLLFEAAVRVASLQAPPGEQPTRRPFGVSAGRS